ncbi:MAG: cyclase family protein [Candidatus Hydrothermarchaeales archaeon]
MKILDISVPISEKMQIFPGDPEVEIKRVAEISKGDVANLSSILLGTHTGTHIDPPLHFIEDAMSIDEVPLEHLVGRAKVFDFSDIEEEITARDLKNFDDQIHEGSIILLKTRNSELWGGMEFPEEFIYLNKDASEYLAKKRIKTVGIDSLSIEKYGSKTTPTHLILLENNILIIEGLNLKDVSQGGYFFVGLPLKIKGGDGGPARAILIEGLYD